MATQRNSTVATPKPDFKATLVRTRVTKGAVRYDNPDLGLNLYLRKEQVTVEGKTGYPSEITLNIEFGEFTKE